LTTARLIQNYPVQNEPETCFALKTVAIASIICSYDDEMDYLNMRL